MKILKTYLVILASLIILITACKKGDVPSVGNRVTQFVGIEQDATNYSILIYNANGLVETYKDVDGSNTISNTTTYGADKRPVSAVGNDVFYKFVYKVSQLDRVEGYQDAAFNNLISTTQFTYVDNKVSQTDIYMKRTATNSGTTARYTFEYNTTGDVKTEKVYYTGANGLEFSYANVYEYDDKINPMTGIFDYKAIVLGVAPAHNVIKILVYGRTNVLDQTVIYTYKYNTAGYPTEALRNFSFTGYSSVTTSKYLYK